MPRLAANGSQAPLQGSRGVEGQDDRKDLDVSFLAILAGLFHTVPSFEPIYWHPLGHSSRRSAD
jgi:hypothetical protein